MGTGTFQLGGQTVVVGEDDKQVFAELCELVEEAIETFEEVGKPLPQPLSRSEFGNLLQRSA